MMKLRRDRNIDRVRIRRLMTDILIAVSVRDADAVLITKNEKGFTLVREVCDLKYIAIV